MSAAAYGDPPPDATAKARQAAEHAIRLDHQLAEAHSALGFVRFRIDWDWMAAETSLRRACELNPGHAPAHHRYALLLSVLGRHAEALREIQLAYELDPLSLIIATAYGRALDFARRHTEAVAQLERTVDLDRTFLQARFDLAMAMVHAGRFQEGIAALEEQIAAGDPRSVARAVLGHAYAASGDTERAHAVLAGLTVWDAAYVHAALGNADVAIDLLDQAVEARVGLVVFLKVEPMVDSLRGHPRFERLLERLRLADHPSYHRAP